MSSSRPSPLRVPTSNLASGLTTLGAEPSHYVSRVHRRSVGETILLFDPTEGTEAVAEIVALQGKLVTCMVAEVRPGVRRGIAGLHLVQGLGKGNKPDQVVRDGVVLGAQSIRFVVSDRSVVQTSDRDEAKLSRLVRIATEAARQCGRSDLPRIELAASFGDALTWGTGSSRPNLTEAMGEKLALVLQPGDEIPLVESILGDHLAECAALEVSIWVGPEGGFSDAELVMLTSRGARVASLGDLVLRTELAAIVAMARVGALLANRRP